MKPYKKLKEIVAGAIRIIQQEAASFDAKPKTGYDGGDDLVTSADLKAQAFYIEQLEKYFPGCGLIGEENGLNKVNPDFYFTIDPLDGTKAFGRKQSDSCASMLALVEKGKVTAAWIGDVNTGELYGYDPEDVGATRIRFGVASTLNPGVEKDLGLKYVQLTDPTQKYTDTIAQVVQPIEDGGIFKSYEVRGGSIGTNMARLWKDEIAALFLVPCHDTPWDNTPVMGINQQLDFVEVRINCTTGEWEIGTPPLVTEISRHDYIIMMTHKDRVDAITARL